MSDESEINEGAGEDAVQVAPDATPEETPTAEATEPLASHTRLRSLGFLAGVIGGFLIAAGALMPWARLNPGFEGDYGLPGVDLWEGVAVLVAGVLIVLGTFLVRFQATYERRRLTCIVVIILAVVSAALTASVMVRAEERIMNLEATAIAIAADTGSTQGEAESLIREHVSVSYLIGFWLALGGALLALIGGILTLRWTKKRSVAAVAEGRDFGAPRSAEGSTGDGPVEAEPDEFS